MTDQELLKEIKHFENFYFLVFEPNPMKDSVRIWVDGGDLRYIYKRETFYKIIKELVSESVENGVKVACTYYGGYYFLDRTNQHISKLSNVNEKQFFSLKQLKKDIDTAKNNSQSLVDINFTERANNYLKLCNFGQPNTKQSFGKIADYRTGLVQYNTSINSKIYNPFN